MKAILRSDYRAFPHPHTQFFSILIKKKVNIPSFTKALSG